VAVEIGVFGEGSLGANAERLRGMGAKVVNRWLAAHEFGDALDRYHAVVLSHTEASQSGVAAAAFGSRVPVIASPVGGLVEQVKTGTNGVLARGTDARALSAAIKQLGLNPQFYRETCANLERTAEQRSMKRFVCDAVSHAFNPIEVHDHH
jgi:glycosyltransferase involved in cell wall biosynthesis